MDIVGMAIQLYFMMDPLGNIPLVVALIRNYPPKKQRMIILRESLFAFGVSLLFMLFGTQIMSAIDVQEESMKMTGGVILFIIGLKMSMESPSGQEEEAAQTEPFLVPIAVPFIAGPGVMAMVTVLGAEGKNTTITGAVLALVIAWVAGTLTLLLGQYISKFLGSKAMEAIQKLMGLALTAMAVNMFMVGFKSFMHSPVK
ncbi:MAG: MarC family protein [bacterium]|nr:MarC family protein [bacterium]